MLKKLYCVLAIAIAISFAPKPTTAQDDTKADKAERAHRKAVVKHDVAKAKSKTKHAYHKVAHTVMKPIDKAKAKHRADEKAEGETH